MTFDKARLLAQLRARIETKLDSLVEAQNTVQSGAIHEENRQEHPKDTRAIEAGYLARGLAERVETTADMVAALRAFTLREFSPGDPIAVAAVVTLEDADGVETAYFVAPAAGGEEFDLPDGRIHTITPESPLGRALIGQLLDDEILLELPGGTKRVTVTSLE